MMRLSEDSETGDGRNRRGGRERQVSARSQRPERPCGRWEANCAAASPPVAHGRPSRATEAAVLTSAGEVGCTLCRPRLVAGEVHFRPSPRKGRRAGEPSGGGRRAGRSQPRARRSVSRPRAASGEPESEPRRPAPTMRTLRSSCGRAVPEVRPMAAQRRSAPPSRSDSYLPKERTSNFTQSLTARQAAGTPGCACSSPAAWDAAPALTLRSAGSWEA